MAFRTFTSAVAANLANPGLGRTILTVNQVSAHTLYILMEPDPAIVASPTVFTAKLSAGETWNCPKGYDGRVSAIMSGVGVANVTEFM